MLLSARMAELDLNLLTALDLAGRVSLLPGQAPAGAIGAALIGNT